MFPFSYSRLGVAVYLLTFILGFEYISSGLQKISTTSMNTSEQGIFCSFFYLLIYMLASMPFIICYLFFMQKM